MDATYEHLDALMYAHENGWPWDNILCGHLNCLIYTFTNGCLCAGEVSRIAGSHDSWAF